MKPGKHLFGAAGIITVTAALIVLTWFSTVQSIDAQRQQTLAQVNETLTSDAQIFAEQINRQILTIDETLRFVTADWEANPQSFDLDAWQSRVTALNGLTRNMLLIDQAGLVRASTATDAIGQDVSGQDFFRALADSSNKSGRMFLGLPSISPAMRQWHLNAARRLSGPDGSFAGAVVVDYRLSSTPTCSTKSTWAAMASQPWSD